MVPSDSYPKMGLCATPSAGHWLSGDSLQFRAGTLTQPLGMLLYMLKGWGCERYHLGMPSQELKPHSESRKVVELMA